MESNDSLLAELKKLTQELASHKIDLYQTRSCLQFILQNPTDLIFAIDAEDPFGNHGFQIFEGRDKTANTSVS
jgi:hypothetical protein